MATILTKRSNTASSVPLAADLTNSTSGAELAVNTADKRVYTKDSGGNVVELGTNPSTLALPSGSVNGVGYLNASKQFTTGSALTFDGTNFATTGGVNLSGRIGFTGFSTDIDNFGLWVSSATSATTLASYSTNPIAFRVNASEQMRLTSTGLGIGTTSPANKLDVRSDTSGTQIRVSTSDNGNILYAGWATGASYIAAAGYNSPALAFQTGGSERARIDSSGNLLVGTNSGGTNGRLTVYEPTVGRLFLTDSTLGTGYGGSVRGYGVTGAGGYVDIGTIDSNVYNQAIVVYNQATAIAFKTNSGSNGGTAERARIDSSGNLLVGITGVTATNAKSWFFDVQQGYQSINHSTASTSGNFFSGFAYNGSYIGSITQAGTTGVLYNITSDHRLKTVTGTLLGHGERIDALEPIEYTWNADGSQARGFLAHKFQEVYPNSVNGQKDAVDAEGKPVYQTMQASTSEVIADLVAEIKSLRQRLAAAGL